VENEKGLFPNRAAEEGRGRADDPPAAIALTNKPGRKISDGLADLGGKRKIA